MKNKTIIALIACGLMTGATTNHLRAGGAEGQAKPQTGAKISKEDAQKTALAKVPNATVKEAELEKEDGKLIWSFDLTTPDTKDITEVNVNAVTGEVVSVEKESAADESKEKAKDESTKQKKDKQAGKPSDDDDKDEKK